MASAAEAPELVDWQRRASWDPHDFVDTPAAGAVNAVTAFTALCMICLNSLAIWVFWYHRLPRTPANVLSMALCFNNLGFGVFNLVSHGSLLIETTWPLPKATAEMFFNQFFLTMSVFVLLAMSIERYMLLVMQRPMTTCMVVGGCANALVTASVLAGVPLFVGMRPVISLSSVFVQPNWSGALPTAWIAIYSIVALILNVGGITLTYMFVYAKFRTAHNRIAKLAGHIPDATLPSSSSPNVPQKPTSGAAPRSSSLPKDMPAPRSSSLPSVVHSGTDTLPSQPVVPLAAQASVETRAQRNWRLLEEQILYRAMVTFAVFSSNWVPLLAQLFYSFITNKRTPAALDLVTCVTIHVASVADPIILLVIDTRFSKAFHKSFGKWIPWSRTDIVTGDPSSGGLSNSLGSQPVGSAGQRPPTESA